MLISSMHHCLGSSWLPVPGFAKRTCVFCCVGLPVPGFAKLTYVFYCIGREFQSRASCTGQPTSGQATLAASDQKRHATPTVFQHGSILRLL